MCVYTILTHLLEKFERRVAFLKKKAHDLSELKHELYEQKRKLKGKKGFIYRKLTAEQLDFVSRICKVEPHLYEIRKTFRPGFNINVAPGVVKSVYYARQNPVYKALTDKELAQCKNAGLKVYPYKYKIYLDTLK